VDAVPLSEALAAVDNIGYPWSSLPQDIQIVILKMNQIACSEHFKKIRRIQGFQIVGRKI
jgi:hypothetical protein